MNASTAEIIVSATPIDLARLVTIDKPIVRARYEYAEVGAPGLSTYVDAFFERLHRGWAEAFWPVVQASSAASRR
jgi:predicted GTPase